MICSTIDDIDYNISHVIRGEDHITNTAIQIQLFESLEAKPPIFGHLGLIKTKDSKISKREGGFEIESLREIEGLESNSINNFLSSVGSSRNTSLHTKLESIVDEFDITIFSKGSTIFEVKDIELINEKIISNLSYEQVNKKLKSIIGEEISESFWLSVRPNLQKLSDIKLWWDICYNFQLVNNQEQEYIGLAKTLLPEGDFDNQTWQKWTDSIKKSTNRAGKNLYMPIRIALTGMNCGPELSVLLPLIGRSEVVKRLG
jgi:glutamyl-tRNA synthetase